MSKFKYIFLLIPIIFISCELFTIKDRDNIYDPDSPNYDEDAVSSYLETPGDNSTSGFNNKGWTKIMYGGTGPNNAGNLSRYEWASTETIETVTTKWTKNHGESTNVKTGDIDGDGYLEIVTLINTSQAELCIYDFEGNEVWSKSTNSGFITLADVQGDESVEIIHTYRNPSNQLIADIYDGEGTVIKTINRGSSGSDSFWWLETVKDDKLFFQCYAGYSLSPRGLSICSYFSGSEVSNYLIGAAFHYMAAVDTNNDEILEFAFGTGTSNNGGNLNGTTDSELWAIMIDENGNELFKTNNIAGETGLTCAMYPIITDIDADGFNDDIIYFEKHDSSYSGTNRIHILDTSGTTLRTVSGPDNGQHWYAAIGIYNAPTYDIFASTVNEEKIYVYGAPTSSTEISLIATSPSGAGIVLAVNDINADGIDDIIVYQSSSGNIRALKNDLTTEIFSYTVGGTFKGRDAFAISDIDNDGKNEILYANDTTFFVIGDNS